MNLQAEGLAGVRNGRNALPAQLDHLQYDYTLHYRKWNDGSSECIAKHVGHTRDRLARLLPEPPGPLLDIGCGAGFALLAARQLGFKEILGIDLDGGQVAECLRQGLPVERVDDTAAFLLGRPNQFSVVLMLDVLEHVPVREQIDLMRAVRVAMRPGGKTILQVPNASAALASRWRYIDHTHHCSFTEHSLEFVLLNAGFTDVRVAPPPPLRRPSLRLWRSQARAGLRRWFCKWLWRQILWAELGEFEDPAKIPVDLNMMATARKPADPTPDANEAAQ